MYIPFTMPAALVDDRRAVTTLEYAILGSLLVGTITAAVTTVGTNLSAHYNYIVSMMP